MRQGPGRISDKFFGLRDQIAHALPRGRPRLPPAQRWSQIPRRALTFALTISPDVIAVHVATDERRVYLKEEWHEFVELPVNELGMAAPKLVVLSSPYRFVITPLVDYILDLSRKSPDRQIALLIPEVVEQRWYYQVLHNQRAAALKTLLYFKGNPQILVINMPWYVQHPGDQVPG